MKKRFVVITILILVIIVAIFLVYSNFSSSKTYNLSEKFNIYGKVVDYGTYEEEEKEELIDKLNKVYLENKEKGKKVYVVLGNEKEIVLANYEEIMRGDIRLITGKATQKLNLLESIYTSRRFAPTGNKIDMIVEGKSYSFKLKENENVYFIIVEDEK